MFESLLSPAVLFFVLGAFASLIHSDLEFPDGLGKTLALYLMFAIGFKGGAQLSTQEVSLTLLAVALFAVTCSFLMPFLGYGLLRLISTQTKENSIAIAAHYGSVSLVTFLAAIDFLESRNVFYQPFFTMLLALMETPAIISAMVMKFFILPPSHSNGRTTGLFNGWHHILFGGSALLLLGSFLIGFLTGQDGYAEIKGFITTPFKGVLCLFLLEMGLVSGRKIREFQLSELSLVLYALIMPFIGVGIGLFGGHFFGFEPGSTMLLIVLMASASYIVVPAAMRLSLPQADPGLYISLSLGVTFPFNIVFGIPLYYYLSGLKF